MASHSELKAAVIGVTAGALTATCAIVAAYYFVVRTRGPRFLEQLHESGLSLRMAKLLQQLRGGDLYIFKSIPAKRTALIVIDMQEFFLSEKNCDKPYFCSGRRSLVPVINRAAAALRSRGGRVIWITSDVGADSLDNWSVLYGEFFPVKDGLRSHIQKSLSVEEGRWGLSYDPKVCKHGMDGPLDPDLKVMPQDLIVKKDRFSPFSRGGKHQGCTPLDGATGPKDFAQRLRSMGVDNLLLCGVSTACCVATTAQDAMQRDFRVTVLSDATGASQMQDHVGQLDHLAIIMADVRTADSAIAALN